MVKRTLDFEQFMTSVGGVRAGLPRFARRLTSTCTSARQRATGRCVWPTVEMPLHDFDQQQIGEYSAQQEQIEPWRRFNEAEQLAERRERKEQPDADSTKGESGQQ